MAYAGQSSFRCYSSFIQSLITMAEEFKKVEGLTSYLSDNNRLQDAKRLVEQVDLFENIVSHSYLQSLGDCEVVEYQESDLTTMRWYEITKIVIEKNVFFPDKLSMLYMSLHSVAKNVVLIVDIALMTDSYPSEST